MRGAARADAALAERGPCLGIDRDRRAGIAVVVGAGLEVTREIDSGRETVAIPLPAIVTADLRLNTPRSAALPMVMKARSKPLAVRPAAEFGIDLAPRLTIEKISPPPERVAGRSAGSVSELAAYIAAEVSQMEAL